MTTTHDTYGDLSSDVPARGPRVLGIDLRLIRVRLALLILGATRAAA